MTYRTLEGVLNPDGQMILPPDELPDHPVRVMVTFWDDVEEPALSELGDYLDELTDYEKRLARGEVQWQ